MTLTRTVLGVTARVSANPGGTNPDDRDPAASVKKRWLTFCLTLLAWVGASIWLGAVSAPLVLKIAIYLIATIAYIIATTRLARAVRRRRTS